MPYTVTFHTQAYKPHQSAVRSLGTQDDHMAALDGLTFVEESTRELAWRIHLAHGNWPYDLSKGENEQYAAWRHDPRNIVRFFDNSCGCERTILPEVPGFHQGYVNADAIVLEVEEKGSAKIDFCRFYDQRQYDTHMDGCYISIEKA